MNCRSCLRAQQIADQRDYREGCLMCGARKLAHMDREERARTLDAIQFISGWDMRCEAVRLLELEAARILALRRRKEKAPT